MTGVTGFVGRALVHEFLGKGFQIKALVRKPSCLGDEVEQIVLDLEDIEGERIKKDLFKGVDVVVHAAARVHLIQDKSQNPLADFRKLNRDATMALASMAAETGVKRFVFLSSIKVNGEETFPHGWPRIFKPDDKYIPKDYYGLSKYEAEQGLMALAKETDMEVVVIRIPLVYGPGVKANFAYLINWIQRGLPLPLGAVKNKRSFVALDNLVSFISLCVDCSQSPKAANQVFLISDGEDVSTKQLLCKTAFALDKKIWIFPVPVFLISFLSRLVGKENVVNRLLCSLQLDSSKARDLLGWMPVITMDEQLKKTVASFLKNEKTL